MVENEVVQASNSEQSPAPASDAPDACVAAPVRNSGRLGMLKSWVVPEPEEE